MTYKITASKLRDLQDREFGDEGKLTKEGKEVDKILRKRLK